MPAAIILVIALATAAPAAGSSAICEATPSTLTGAPATARNLKTVEGIYAAFGRGDVEAILGCLADDAAWDHWKDNHAQRAAVPWLTKRSGRAGAAAFFAYIAKWKVNAFDVRNLMAGGSGVAAEIEADFDVTQTGGRLADEEIHYWSFNDKGQVVRFRHYSDTAKHIAAAKGAK
jgi:uncharacterized protein